MHLCVNPDYTVPFCMPLGTKFPGKMMADWQSSQVGTIPISFYVN